MAPNSFFNRLSTLKVGGTTTTTTTQPDNSSVNGSAARHARVASISSNPTPTISVLPPRISVDPKSIDLRASTVAAPKLVLTTDSTDRDHSRPSTPGSIHRPSSAIYDPTEPLTLSPDSEPRSSAEEVKGKRHPQGLTSGAYQVATSSDATRSIPIDLATPRVNSLQPAFEEVLTPKPTVGATLPPTDDSRLVNGTKNKSSPIMFDSPPSQQLKGKPSKSSMRRGSVTSADGNKQPPLTESPTQTFIRRTATSTSHLLGVPSDADGLSDGGSVVSSVSKKKTPWRKTSTSSFRGKSGSTGGAFAALASTGLSLAHPATSPTASTTISPPSRTTTTNSFSLRSPTRSFTNLTQTSPKGSTRSPKPNVSSNSDDEDGDSEGVYDSDSQDGLSFTDDVVPVTGFAVASSKRNSDFHDLFPDVPEGDYLIDDYGCALQREILIQGRLYISENYMCFHANIFGWVTDLTIPFTNVTGLEKRMTAFVIPNAIQISTHEAKHTFASFLSRDTTFDVITNIWRLAHPGGPPSILSASRSEAGSSILDTTNAGRPALEVVSSAGGSGGEGDGSSKEPGQPTMARHRPTACACSVNKQHYNEKVMECVLPGTPEKIYNLIFASGFIKEFMSSNQKLIDIQISDWHPTKEGSPLLGRNMSYIKPLNGSIGPKSTKCNLKDETAHIDFDDYACMLTTTTTPDVPSGGVFSIKTRTCIMWAGGCNTKVMVTTGVEWTGRSFIKAIIERSAIDGQKTYHAELEKAMRHYITEHPTEFLPEGANASDAIELGQVQAEVAAEGAAQGTPAEKTPEELAQERASQVEERGLQWALDTINGTRKVAEQSFWDLIGIIKDIWENRPAMFSALGSDSRSSWIMGVVAVLVATNLWSVVSLRDARSRNEMTRKRILREGSDRLPGYGSNDDDRRKMANVANDAVKAFWESMMIEQQKPDYGPILEQQLQELTALREVVQSLESRITTLEGAQQPIAALD